jgi:hypothetical protein
VSDARALSYPTRDALLDRFTGGLLVTCGLLTIGAPPGRALHGDISHRPATAVRAKPSRGRARVSLAADVDSESDFGQALQLQRRICSGFDDAGAAFLSVRDRNVNTGVAPAPVAVLYHLKLQGSAGGSGHPCSSRGRTPHGPR